MDDQELDQEPSKIFKKNSPSDFITLNYEPDSSLYTEGWFRVTSAGFTVVYTDGSCLSNGRQDPKGSIGIFFGPCSPLNVSLELPSQYKASNNTAEIYAVTAALRICSLHFKKSVEIRTDSKFLLTCIVEHVPLWQQNGWLKTNNKPVSNQVELKELLEALRGFTVRWVHVPGHSTDAGNNCADFLARMATLKLFQSKPKLWYFKN